MEKKSVLGLLVCPVCKGELTYRPSQQALCCLTDKLAYPIEDGIPMMVVQKARQLEEEN